VYKRQVMRGTEAIGLDWCRKNPTLVKRKWPIYWELSIGFHHQCGERKIRVGATWHFCAD
jgi:hypothetical protein